MSAVRGLLGAVGLSLILVGLWKLLGTDLPDLVNIGVFLAGGVLAHDLVLAPAVAVVGVTLLPRLPRPSRAPVVVGLVVLVSVTLIAVPVLGRYGAKPSDPWLLPREYGPLWLGFAAVVALGVVVASVVRRRKGVS